MTPETGRRLKSTSQGLWLASGIICAVSLAIGFTYDLGSGDIPAWTRPLERLVFISGPIAIAAFVVWLSLPYPQPSWRLPLGPEVRTRIHRVARFLWLTLGIYTGAAMLIGFVYGLGSENPPRWVDWVGNVMLVAGPLAMTAFVVWALVTPPLTTPPPAPPPPDRQPGRVS